MIKKSVLLLMLLILCSSLVLATTETNILNSWVSFDHSFVNEGDIFQIYVSGVDYSSGNLDHSMARILVNNITVDLVSYGDCEKGAFYEICYVNASFDETGNKIDASGNLHAGVHFNITKFDYGDSLSITKSADKAVLEEGESTRIKFTITNTGAINLFNIRVSEILGEGFGVFKFSENFETLEDVIVLPSGASEEYFIYVEAGNDNATFRTEVKYDTIYFTNKELFADVSIIVIPPVEEIVEEIVEDVVEVEIVEESNSTGMIVNTETETYESEDNFFKRIIKLIKSFFN